MRKRQPQTKPVAPPEAKKQPKTCTVPGCGRPAEYMVDTHGMPTDFPKCAPCHERACYLETRYTYDR